MRVATKTMYDQVIYNLSNKTGEMNQANQVISSGKRINNLSDDPVGLTQSLQIKSTLSNIEQLGRNINLGKSWLTAAESALTQTQNLISDASVLCVQMANATVDGDQRQGAAVTVQNILDEIISLANTQLAGRYIFAGSNTAADAFAADGTYNGDGNPFAIVIGKNTTIEIGHDGGEVFNGVIGTLQDLKADLAGNDVNGIQEKLDTLAADLDYVSRCITDIGAKTVRLEIKENIYESVTISDKGRLSRIEDADFTAAIIDLKEKELAYQAALSSAAKLMELSLVDYVK